MDLVLIRNVLIYFARDVRERILQRIHTLLRPGGYLLLGTSESLPREVPGFEQQRLDRTICYRRV